MAKGQLIPCAVCGKEKYFYPSGIKPKNYCSSKCRAKGVALQKENKVHTKCANCGADLLVWPCKMGKNNFCNAACMGAYYSKQGTEAFTCDYCKAEFLKNPHKLKRQKYKFCSTECRKKWIAENKRTRVIVACDYCGKNVERFPFELRKSWTLFCSRKCKSEYQKLSQVLDFNCNWRGGHDGYRGENWPKQRLKALERDKFKCQECGTFGNGVKLIVHHKIPFRFFCEYKKANKLINLITLCNSCHSKQESHYWTEVPENLKHLL